MIIISQGEEKIVNFDNVESIGMIEFFSCIGIKAKMQDAYIDLGSYKDVERAKEVLKDIIDWIENKCDFSMNNDGINVTRKGDVFYMPKE